MPPAIFSAILWSYFNTILAATAKVSSAFTREKLSRAIIFFNVLHIATVANRARGEFHFAADALRELKDGRRLHAGASRAQRPHGNRF